MAKRGRPRLLTKPCLIYVKLRLYPGADDDLLAFFAAIPPGLRAALVKEALRSGAAVADHEDAWGQDQLLDALDALVEG